MKKLTSDVVVAIWSQRYGERKGNGIKVFMYIILTVILFHILIIPYEIYSNYGNNTDYLIPYLFSFLIFIVIEGITAIYIFCNYQSKMIWQIYLRIWLKGFMYIVGTLYLSLILFLFFYKITYYERLIKKDENWFYFYAILIWIFVPIILNLFSTKVIPFLILKEKNNNKALSYFFILVPVFSGMGMLMSKYFGGTNPDIRTIIVSIGSYLIGMLLYYFSLMGFTIHINLLLYGIPREKISLQFNLDNRKEK